MIDASADKFAPTWFERYFDWGAPTQTLSFVTAIGRSRIEAAATVMDRDGATPVRSRQALEKLSGEVPAIKMMYKMSETDYRNFEAIQALNISEATKKAQLLDLMYGDIKRVVGGTYKRVDAMCLQAISTGKITLTTSNNPDGIITSSDIDLLMPSGNFKNATATWKTANSGKPITDINTVVAAGEAEGKSFSKILMDRATFLYMSATDEVRNMVSGFFRINTKDQITPVLSQVNEYLEANMLPQIEIVNEKIGIEKDGVISTISPFATDVAVFVPAGKLGVIHNALALEEMRPVKQVSYAKSGRTLVSKWSQNEPFAEYTKGELNAFPGVESIDSIFILDIAP